MILYISSSKDHLIIICIFKILIFSIFLFIKYGKLFDQCRVHCCPKSNTKCESVLRAWRNRYSYSCLMSTHEIRFESRSLVRQISIHFEKTALAAWMTYFYCFWNQTSQELQDQNGGLELDEIVLRHKTDFVTDKCEASCVKCAPPLLPYEISLRRSTVSQPRKRLANVSMVFGQSC